MKKLSFYICIIFIAICSLSFFGIDKSFVDTNCSNNLAYAESEGTEVSVTDWSQIGSNLTADFKLIEDIDVSTDNNYQSSEPIGWDFQTKTYTPFTGTLDGNGYAVTGIKLVNGGGNYVGIFGMLENATIKNLKIEIDGIECSSVGEVASIFVGGIAGSVKSSKIQNCTVVFNSDDSSNTFFIRDLDVDTGQESGVTNSIFFGGIAGSINEGSDIKNCITDVCIDVLKDEQQGKTVNIGGVVGECNYSKITNTLSKLTNTCTIQNEGQNVLTNIGGVCGNISGNNSVVQNCYAQSDSNIQNLGEINFGGVIGSVESSFVPNAKNINYVYSNPKNKQNNANLSSNIFGKQSMYQTANCKMEVFEQDDFSIFELPEYWNTDIMWDFENIWSTTGDSVPTLQVFKTYTIDLNTNPIVDFGLLSPTDKDVSTIQFENANQGTTSQTFKYGDVVNVKIEITNNFKKYFDLDTISVANLVVYNKAKIDNNSKFSVTLPNNDENIKYYMLSYTCCDSTVGQVSFSLSKITYSLEVKTENALMGMVRNQFSSSSLDQFEQSITYGNKYTFLSVPTTNDFAFSKWTFEKEENESVELNIETSSYTFIFGGEVQGDGVDFNALIIDDYQLMAHWTSNVCKITIEVKDGDNVISSGFTITDREGNQLEDIVSVQKGDFVIIAELSEEYEIDGWYSHGRLLSNSLTLESQTEDEEMILTLKVAKINRVANLTWLWITLGCLGGAGLITVIVVIIVKKSKDNAYKNFY